MKKKIIVVDDSADNLEIIQFLLESEGYEVHPFREEITLAGIANICPNLIVLDIRLPKISGHEICMMIKNNAGSHHIPVILLSADVYDNHKFQKSFAEAYIEKPYDINNLLEVIKKYIL